MCLCSWQGTAGHGGAWLGLARHGKDLIYWRDRMKETIKFEDLSLSLKIAVVMIWVIGCLSTIGFFVGFIEGLLSI